VPFQSGSHFYPAVRLCLVESEAAAPRSIDRPGPFRQGSWISASFLVLYLFLAERETPPSKCSHVCCQTKPSCNFPLVIHVLTPQQTSFKFSLIWSFDGTGSLSHRSDVTLFEAKYTSFVMSLRANIQKASPYLDVVNSFDPIIVPCFKKKMISGHQVWLCW
jgi:hypothetical protein